MTDSFDGPGQLVLAIPFIRYKVRELYRRCRAKKVTVRTAAGSIRGAQVLCPKFGYVFTQFLGIPYARPPLNDLRFCVSVYS